MDLGQSYKIATVSLTKRAGCCTEQLSNFEIRIGDTLDDENGGVANPAISGSPFEVGRKGWMIVFVVISKLPAPHIFVLFA